MKPNSAYLWFKKEGKMFEWNVGFVHHLNRYNIDIAIFGRSNRRAYGIRQAGMFIRISMF